MKIPCIKIKYSLDEEVKLFFVFLHNPFFPQNRNKIFRSFNKLEVLLKTTKTKNQEKLVIKKFIKEFRKKNDKKIKEIVFRSKKLLNTKSKITLIELSKLMDYQWRTNQPDYMAMPTILPFSPFGDNIFYFSILEQIEKNHGKNILFIASHEISHFIFYDILKKEESKIKKPIPNALKNYFKEALAVVLLNNKPICDILDLHNYKGNPEIHGLRIKKPDGKIISFTKFVDEYYQSIKIKKKKPFEIFLREILDILLPVSKEFSEKRVIWNRYGNQLHKNYSAFYLYQKPIKIKKRTK